MSDWQAETWQLPDSVATCWFLDENTFVVLSMWPR